jgi:hypothetical protein
VSDNKQAIEQRFEQCLLDGLQGQPLVTKDGPVTDPETGEILKGPPESSFLSVVLNYIKLLRGEQPPKTPTTGKAKGMLAEFENRMPFGARPN